MSDFTTPMQAPPGPPPVEPPPRPARHGWRIVAIGFAALALLGIGTGIGAAAGHSAKVIPGPTVTKTVQVPGPTVTQTVTVPAPPPPAGAVIGKWSGTGNQVTPAFNAPADGNYIVSWSYSGNVDPTIGGGTNFAITTTDSSAEGMGLPNDIAATGSGSTEVTGASGTQSFNVQATGQWTIKVVSA